MFLVLHGDETCETNDRDGKRINSQYLPFLRFFRKGYKKKLKKKLTEYVFSSSKLKFMKENDTQEKYQVAKK